MCDMLCVSIAQLTFTLFQIKKKTPIQCTVPLVIYARIKNKNLSLATENEVQIHRSLTDNY
jgi:hypothetical protein